MSTNIRYAAVLAPQPEGGFTVTFPDIPEAITEGDDRDAALFNATEVLTLCLEQRMEDGEAIPPRQRSGAVNGLSLPQQSRSLCSCGGSARHKASPWPIWRGRSTPPGLPLSDWSSPGVIRRSSNWSGQPRLLESA